jgi:hypothetical protein
VNSQRSTKKAVGTRADIRCPQVPGAP